jgi:DNA-binding transcriptional MerR regulator
MAALSSEIPDKLYFRIGDVSQICDVPAYVLRFWETEFPQLRPNKGGTGQRLYRRREVELVLRIRQLLYDEGYTIAGARQLLKTEQRQTPPQLSLLGPEPPDIRKLKGLRRELESIVAMLSRPAGVRPAPVPMRSPRRGTPSRGAGGIGPDERLSLGLFGGSGSAPDGALPDGQHLKDPK